MKRTKLVIILVLLICFGTTTTVCAQGEDINIGAIVTFTGGGAFFGNIMRAVAQGIVDEMNNEGIKGFGKINIRFYDDSYDAAVAAGQIQRAVSQGAHFIWGGIASPVETMMVAKAQELKIPCYLNNEHVTESIPCNTRYALTSTAGTLGIGKVTADNFKKKNVKTYAIIGADYAYGRSLDKIITKYLEGSGIRKIYEVWHDFSKVDYTAEISKLKRLKPDAVVRPFGGVGDFVIVKQMKDAGYWPRIYQANISASGYELPLMELGEKYMVGVSAPSYQNPDHPKWIEFAKTHKEKYLVWPTWFSEGLHDTLRHLKKVVETAGSLDPEKLADTMHKVTYDGVMGYPFGPFQQSGWVQNATTYLLEFKKGSPKWTNKIAVHREVVHKVDLRPMCKEELEEFLKK
jgi:branched-chain amino acid transport system substrate-binding protein